MKNAHVSFTRCLIVGFLGLFLNGWFPSLTSAAPPADPCLDISMAGQEVFFPGAGGVANSGVLNFDDATVGPDPAYAGCMTDPGSDAIGPFQLEGWVWNSNLGWVSLSCVDGVNRGLPCGGIDYGVTIDDAGIFHGYAWGDNTGWLSFNCDNNASCATSNYYVRTENADPLCIGQVFTTQPGCLDHPAESVFAWSDSVGWLDITGVIFPWQTLVNDNAEKVDVTLSITPNPGDAFNKKVNAPPADGVTPYTLDLLITDQKTHLPIDPKDFTIFFQLNWDDTVDTDQTDNTIQAGNYSNCTDCGAVKKPLTFNDFHYDVATQSFKADVTSIAPTSNMNGYDGILTDEGYQGESGIITSSYENFILPSQNPAGVGGIPPNILILNSVSASVQKNGACAYGDTAVCIPKAIPFPSGNGSERMSFRPAAEITNLNVNNKDYFSAQYNVASTFNVEASCVKSFDCGSATVEFQLGIDDPLSPFQFVDDADHSHDYFLYNLAKLPATLQAVPILLPPNTQAKSQVGNAYIYSTISYTLNGKMVAYYSNKLPRVVGTLVNNPVVTIRGNVYSTGVTNPQTGIVIRSLGDVGTNILRDTIFRNVSHLLAGTTKPIGSANISGFQPASGFNVAPQGAVVKLLPDGSANSVPKVYYFGGDVTLGNGVDDINITGERTIIVKGGSVYIESNIYSPPGAAGTKPRLGIIVLKDSKDSPPVNVFIAPNVTNIQANLFTDGSVMSYDGNPNTIDSKTGEPIFTTEAARHDILINQLLWEGSLASLNTIGGALATIPILGDGRAEAPVEGQYQPVPNGRSRARLYDLNFLRYYGPVFQRDANGNAMDLNNSGGTEAALMPIGDLIPPELVDNSILRANGLDNTKDFNAVYIYFDPPPATLPGFGVGGSLNLKQLSQ